MPWLPIIARLVPKREKATPIQEEEENDVRLKPGVKFLSSQLALSFALIAVQALWSRKGFIPTITSVADGSHMVGSLHYSEQAFDIRTKDLPDVGVARELAKQLSKNIGNDFDVVLEETHIHVEYDPKGGY